MLRLVLACLVVGGVRAWQGWIAQAATQFAFTPPKGVRRMYEGGRAMPSPTWRVDGDAYDACLASRGYHPTNPRNL
jgi:hypothetical protein